MRTIVVGGAIVGALLLSVPAFAQQKTVKACTQEWQANKDANQAKGVTLKAYVTQCRAGGAAQTQTAPSAPAAAQKTTAAAPAATGQKTVKACVEEWRANKAANEAKGITQKAYVADCRTGKTTAQPTLFPTAQPQQTEPRQRRRQLRHNRRSRHQGRQPGLHRLLRRLRPVQTSTRRKGRPSSAASAERSSGPISIQRSITSAATRPMARPKRARICASGMPRARACAPRKTRSIPEVKERSAAPVT